MHPPSGHAVITVKMSFEVPPNLRVHSVFSGSEKASKVKICVAKPDRSMKRNVLRPLTGRLRESVVLIGLSHRSCMAVFLVEGSPVRQRHTLIKLIKMQLSSLRAPRLVLAA